MWHPDENLIWVKNFLKHQAKSPKFLVAAIKSLNHCSVPEDLRAEFDLYNQRLLSGVAPSQHISLTKRECVLIRDNFYCQYCGKEIDEAVDYEMDHIIPVLRGGKDNYLNL
ncbi:HNH endonuclease, partial [Patescibacteria group bacterium]|nr:HNH endonuclease [Patescibacteria group bacterium]